MYSHSQILESCQTKLTNLDTMIPSGIYRNRLLEIDHLVNADNFWQSPQKAAEIMKERQKLSDILEKLSAFKEKISFYQECLVSIPEELDINELVDIEKQISDLEFKQILNDPIDDTAAILSISAGAGGLEAANWVTMLLRMYLRYAQANNLKCEYLDMKPSEEHSSICTDSVSIRIEGPYAYGFLKGESGVHRLVRNSPFSSSDARHTSFAAVSVTPDIEDKIDIKIEDKDLEITTQTAGGPGGQNQNRVKSAIRLKHLPTGINILVRTERDQLSNKNTAFKMLKAKLYDIEMKKKQAEKDKQLENLSDVSFGHQIRSYVESPQSLVADHRSELKNANYHSILDGNIDEFLMAFLRINK